MTSRSATGLVLSMHIGRGFPGAGTGWYTGMIWVVMALELMFVSTELAMYVITTTLMMAVMTTLQTRLACLTIR